MGTLKISLDDATVATYHNATRYERTLAKRAFSFFVRRETGALKELIEDNSTHDENEAVIEALCFMHDHKGFSLGYQAKSMTREEMNAR